MSRVIVELSHSISDGMLTCPGLPGPRVTTDVARERSPLIGMDYDIARVDMVGHTGTYIDAPFLFHADGADVADLPLERLFNVPIVIIRAPRLRAVGPDLLGDPARLWGKAVLVHTGWSAAWGSPDYRGPGHPFLVGEVADALVAANVALVGIDSLDIDDTSLPTRPCHHTLLGAGIPIIEQMTNLDAVPDTGARLVALPAPIRGMGSFPLRAVAWIEHSGAATL
ncbi:cyclase family protein [Streptomyces gardneri]|uniref:cyclase family protein n=1 Tax=Nocardia TaxID=1817 RepID=UPI00135B2B58|nr:MULTISPECIES: cyclase family protein [Nocardia]MBF6168887.1 cyclase family protein [Streptomyces gardneri]MBF6205084.1 cyclase family protein [Streptomyces gardneri]